VTQDNQDDEDGLVSRLRVIEDQPLAHRADAYGHVHDELRGILEGGDVQREQSPGGSFESDGVFLGIHRSIGAAGLPR